MDGLNRVLRSNFSIWQHSGRNGVFYELMVHFLLLRWIKMQMLLAEDLVLQLSST